MAKAVFPRVLMSHLDPCIHPLTGIIFYKHAEHINVYTVRAQTIADYQGNCVPVSSTVVPTDFLLEPRTFPSYCIRQGKLHLSQYNTEQNTFLYLSLQTKIIYFKCPMQCLHSSPREL